jgi:hypothetical protein
MLFHSFHAAEVGPMHIPAVPGWAAVPVDLHEPGSRFDQTTSHQARLAEMIRTVPVAELFGFG